MEVDKDFLPSLTPPPISKKARDLESVLAKVHYKGFVSGSVLALPTALLIAHADVNTGNLNFSCPMGLALQRDKVEGRATSNYSFDNRLGSLLNTPNVKEVMRETYGNISNMSLKDIIDAILRLESKVPRSDMVLWKIDLKAAFNLLFFEASRAGLFAMTLNSAITIISLVGNFGWTGTPFAFGVISQSLLFAIRERIQGNVEICTDDLCGVSSRTDVENDMAIVKDIILLLLGPFSINESKTIMSRQADMVGWYIDLDTSLVTMSEHNLLRTLYDFMQVKREAYIQVKFIQKLASYSSRYSTICRYMKPLSSYLYSASSGYHSANVRVKVNEDLGVVVDLWILMLVLTVIQPTRFQRSLSSFAIAEPSLIPNFDASLTGLSIILFQVIYVEDQYGRRQVVGHRVVAVLAYKTPYQLHGDSSFQNSMEFIATVTIMGVLVSLGIKSVALTLLGDSRTSLHWSFKQRFPSSLCKAAAIQFMQLMAHPEVDIVISDTEYINTLLNTHSDLMSRQIASPLSLGYDKAVIYDLSSNPTLAQWVDMMDPSIPFPLSGLHSHWSCADSLLQVLLTSKGGWVP